MDELCPIPKKVLTYVSKILNEEGQNYLRQFKTRIIADLACQTLECIIQERLIKVAEKLNLPFKEQFGRDTFLQAARTYMT